MEYALASDSKKLLLTIDQSGAQNRIVPEKDKVGFDIKSPDGGVVQYRIVNIARGPLQNVNSSSTSTTVNPIQGFLVINDLNEEHSTNIRATKAIPRKQPSYPSRKQRDEEKKATHKEVERRRRDRMNKLLSRLKEQLPDDGQSRSCNGDSKVSILVKACEYIEKMQEKDNSFIVCLEENEKLERENLELKVENEKLRKDIERLNGIIQQSRSNVKQEKA